MKRFKRTTFSLIIAAVIIWSAPVSADTLFTFAGDCSTASCFGSTYTLVIGDANDATNSTYTANLIINTSAYSSNIPSPVYIDAVDIKVVNSIINPPGIVLTDAPGGASNWNIVFNDGQAATDCSSGGGFFICARDEGSNTLAPVDGGILSWLWTFSSNDAISFGHIGASYNNADGTVNGQNTSISSAVKVPEPSAFLLVGFGLVAMVGVGRRYRSV